MIRKLASEVDVLTVEIEHIDTGALAAIEVNPGLTRRLSRGLRGSPGAAPQALSEYDFLFL